uniref:Splicing factor, arginine/serine-rich 7 n=1 Tax=Lepeophtheirus salmonis TaxID=72036 RepID=D3PHD7_LEPSM|nr:Splicing factor, arginine/serine-rich 7 [Lepeophtheirus salmonis]
MRGKIYIGNLNETIRKSELRQEFEKFGEISDLFVNHGFAHLTYVDTRSSEDAIRIMDGEVFFGSKLRVEMSQDHEEGRRGRGYSPPPSHSRHGGPPYRGGGMSRGGGRSHDMFHNRRSSPSHSGFGRGGSPPRRDDYYSRRHSPPPPRYRSRSPIGSRYSSSHRMPSPSRSSLPPRDNYGPPQRSFSDRDYRGRGSYNGGRGGGRYQDDYRPRDLGRSSDRESNGLSRGYDSRKPRGRGGPPRDGGSRSFGGPPRDGSRSRGEGPRDEPRRFDRDSRSRGGPPPRDGYRSRGPPRGAPKVEEGS